MCPQPARLGSFLNLFFDLLVQLLDPFLQLHVQAKQFCPSLTGVRRQSQALQRRVSRLTPQPAALSQAVIECDGLQCML
jgi:hypothetical protein